MKVKELILQLQKLDENAEVYILGRSEGITVWNSPCNKIVDITADEYEEIIPEEYDDYFSTITPVDDSDLLDMMYINKAFN